MSKAKALSIGCSLTDFKKGCHSEFVTCPTQVGRISGRREIDFWSAARPLSLSKHAADEE